MKKLAITTALLILVAAPTLARAERIRATLTGYEEVRAVSTVAKGEFSGRISNDEQSIDYELRYSGLQGGSDTGSHPLRSAERERQHRYLSLPDGGRG